MPLPCWRSGTRRSLITLLRAQAVEECSSVPRMIQARPEVEFDESMLLLLEVLLLLLEALDGVEPRDEVGDAPGVRRLWRRRRLWRGRWIAMVIIPNNKRMCC
jgi:hypothetical protein